MECDPPLEAANPLESALERVVSRQATQVPSAQQCQGCGDAVLRCVVMARGFLNGDTGMPVYRCFADPGFAKAPHSAIDKHYYASLLRTDPVFGGAAITVDMESIERYIPVTFFSEMVRDNLSQP